MKFLSCNLEHQWRVATVSKLLSFNALLTYTDWDQVTLIEASGIIVCVRERESNIACRLALLCPKGVSSVELMLPNLPPSTPVTSTRRGGRGQHYILISPA